MEEFEPIAGNYYPVNAAIYIEDSKASFAVILDRSQGGTSLKSGSVEIMVQRRTTADDFRGVDEALDETDEGINPYPPYGDSKRKGKGVIVSGSHRLMVGPPNHGATISRAIMDTAFSPGSTNFISVLNLMFECEWLICLSFLKVHMFFAKAEVSSKASPFTTHFVSLTNSIDLPKNVMLTTFSLIHGTTDKYLVRLGHQYGIGEDERLSLPAAVDLSILFPNTNIISITEKTLSGNQDRKFWEETKLQWRKETHKTLDKGTSVVLGPMQIRTFEVLVDSGDASNIPETESDIKSAK